MLTHVSKRSEEPGELGGQRSALKFTTSLEKDRTLFEVSLLKYITEKMIRIGMSTILDCKWHPIFRIFSLSAVQREAFAPTWDAKHGGFDCG